MWPISLLCFIQDDSEKMLKILNIIISQFYKECVFITDHSLSGLCILMQYDPGKSMDVGKWSWILNDLRGICI